VVEAETAADCYASFVRSSAIRQFTIDTIPTPIAVSIAAAFIASSGDPSIINRYSGFSGNNDGGYCYLL